MPNWREFFPEADCIANGDPYLADIVQADDLITDPRYNAELLGLHWRDVDFVEGDMRALQWQGVFDAALLWFTTFGYFGDDDNERVVREALTGFSIKRLSPTRVSVEDAFVSMVREDEALRAQKARAA